MLGDGTCQPPGCMGRELQATILKTLEWSARFGSRQSWFVQSPLCKRELSRYCRNACVLVSASGQAEAKTISLLILTRHTSHESRPQRQTSPRALCAGLNRLNLDDIYVGALCIFVLRWSRFRNCHKAVQGLPLLIARLHLGDRIVLRLES